MAKYRCYASAWSTEGVLAAFVLMCDGMIARAAVDCDVHQGNDTAAIFRDDTSVFTLSLHDGNNFPFRKEVSDLDVTFADGDGHEEYLAALAEHVPRILDAQRPDVVFYLAGADPYEGDRLGRLKLSIDHGLPVVVAMSDGYTPEVDAIVMIHVNTIREAVRAQDLSGVPRMSGVAR
jgi:acetoin utilization deacetylase AcuC-like enzyme